ncbi:hypothetical protein GWI33_017339 [Rhynchophorus ferrugineus]|uniref:Uncharacterized protein n=1 Tax=Rhynchophorus ferrugineus TaxID=354439 RepID=A0A834HYS8_RHYFE|nr:hypothetical protein GWI33_017339 [Rhynchophorus ferrugineus]
MLQTKCGIHDNLCEQRKEIRRSFRRPYRFSWLKPKKTWTRRQGARGGRRNVVNCKAGEVFHVEICRFPSADGLIPGAERCCEGGSGNPMIDASNMLGGGGGSRSLKPHRLGKNSLIFVENLLKDRKWSARNSTKRKLSTVSL